MDALSPASRHLVETLFGPADQAEAAALLEQECGRNLPLCQDSDEAAIDRLRFAALKVSEGHLGRLYQAVGLAQRDWRDLLVEAGFATSVTEHLRWHQGLAPS